MFTRFCNLCQNVTNVQFVKLGRHYRKGSFNKKRRNNIDQIQTSENTEGKTPIIVCKRKQLNFYEGQTYPKYDAIPMASKGWHHYKSKGDYFFVYPYTNIIEESPKVDSFAHFGLDTRIVEALERRSITKPLRIQAIGIPKIMNGANSVIAAETGCGKTLAYLLPMIDAILTWKTVAKRPYNSPLGLIVTPTRELAFQIGLEATKICQHLDIRVKTITGGKTKKIMLDPPVEEVDIVVASFGVISKLTTTKVYNLDMVRHIVLDEADALFHETFEDKLQVFLRRVPIGFVQNVGDENLPQAAQFTLASATMPARMSDVLETIINVESLKRIISDKLHHILVPQKFVRVGPSDKPVELLKYIKPKVATKEQIIIFSNNTTTCNWVSMFLDNNNIQTVQMNGSMPLYERQGKYAAFRSGRCRVLCTTNAASRGLDTIMVRHVLNYEFPTATSDYIHRCGRTGRVDNVNDCRVTNFISTPSEIALVYRIEKAIRKMKPIPICDIHETVEDVTTEKQSEEIFNAENTNQERFNIPY